MTRLRLFNNPSIFAHYLNWLVASNICLDAKNVVGKLSLWTFVTFQYKFLRPLPAVKHLAYVTFIKKFCWNFKRCKCIKSDSQCLKPHTFRIRDLVPKPFFEIDNSSSWFQSRDKNFHCLELSVRWIARFVTPPFLSNYSCPILQNVYYGCKAGLSNVMWWCI